MLQWIAMTNAKYDLAVKFICMCASAHVSACHICVCAFKYRLQCVARFQIINYYSSRTVM